MATWYSYFKANMDRMYLPCPDKWFGTLATATATIGTIGRAAALSGGRATFAQMAAQLTTAGAVTEGGAVAAGGAAIADLALAIGAVTAAAYVGACLGSIGAANIAWLLGDGDAHYEKDQEPLPPSASEGCSGVPQNPNARPGSCANPG